MRLSKEFPKKSILLIDNEEKALKNNLHEYDLIFCPTVYSHLILDKGCDLFINTASFGEMRYRDVKNWFNVIETKIKPKFFFSVNRYLNTLIPGTHDWRHEENG